MSAPQAHQNPKTTTNDVKRRSANFSPTIWGDSFLSYASIETNIEEEQRIQELKERVKRIIMAPIPSKPLEKLELIDAIQRLGVSRHFENEINQVLLQIHNNSYHCYHQGSDDDEDLHTAALYFRLLRQQGYKISCDMFNKFKDVNDAKFKGSLANDIVGLLSLYEATHLRVHGEDILEEAFSFTTTHLESAAHRLSPGPLLQQVKHALYQPFWKGNPRLEARHYLSIYHENNSHNETLLAFAKLDFNLLQKVHQKELSEITRWWKELDFVKKLPFARDRVVESYLWGLGCYYEPEYSFARMIFGKVTAITIVIDDIYDAYGTFEELELFTEAVESTDSNRSKKPETSAIVLLDKSLLGLLHSLILNVSSSIIRWDVSAMVHLPEYMKVCYQALLDLYAEIEEKLGNEGNSYRIHYAREAMKIQVKSYFKEAKWFYDNYTPTMDEYLSEALNTSYFMLATTAFVGMGSVVTKDSLDWVFSDPKIVKATSLIGRLVDDIKSHKFEQKRGHVASSVECYMKEHDATEEQAIIELSKQVNNAWKDVNETCHRPTIFPMQLILRIVNLARMIEVIYKHDDGLTHAGIFLKDIVVSLFVEPVPL